MDPETGSMIELEPKVSKSDCPRIADDSHQAAIDPVAGGLDRPDRGLSRPRPHGREQAADRRRLLSPRRRFRLDHPRGGRGPGAGAGDRARLDRPDPRRGRSPGSWPWGSSPSSGSSTCAPGCPWICGRRCSCAAGSPPSRPGWSPAAARRFFGSCAGRSRCSPGPLLTIMLVTIGGRAWSEHRAVAALPARRPPAPGTCCLIVWDTVRAGEPEPLRLRADRRRPTWSGWPAAGCGSTWRSRRPPGRCRRTPACSPGGGPMSWASTGNRPSETTSPRSPSTSPPTDMTPRDSRPISTIAAARPAWPGASRTTRISRSSVYDTFTRYIALGHRTRTRFLGLRPGQAPGEMLRALV